MIVTEKTKYADFEHAEKYVKDSAVAELKRSAEREYVSMYELTLGQFLQCSNGDYSCILGDTQKPTVLQVFWSRRFTDFVAEFADIMKNTAVPMTPEEKRASANLPQATFSESMLVFVRSYFGLHSFKAAEAITMGEIVIARRDAYASGMFQRKLQQIQMEKYKQHKK